MGELSTPRIDYDTLDDFTKAYIDCALWSSDAGLGICTNAQRYEPNCTESIPTQVQPNERERCPTCNGRLSGTDRSFQEVGMDQDDLADETLAIMVRDCANFQELNRDTLTHWYQVDGETPERAGHDFWLTRNRHGAGFWDRGNDRERAGRLTETSKTCGTVNLYVGDDGKIYAQ